MGDNVIFKVFRGKDRNHPQYDTFSVPYDPNVSIVGVLQHLQRNPVDANNRRVAPPQAEYRCQEKVCGSCAMMVNNKPVASCHTFLRDLGTRHVVVEPLDGFPVVADLVVDRTSMTDMLIESKAFMPVNSTQPQAAATLPVYPEQAESSYDAMDCMKCGVCIAACPNTSASLFLGAAHHQINVMPQAAGSIQDRVQALVGVAEAKGFGFCSNYQACADACPRGVPISVIAELNRTMMLRHLPVPK